MNNIIVGIDFGTCNCSASWINPTTGNPEPIRFKDTGTEKMPSIVHISNSGKISVGLTPFNNLEEASFLDGEERDEILNNTITSIKTKMMQGNKTLRHGKSYGDDEIISFILKKIREQIVVSCSISDSSLERAVLTVPVKFEEWKMDMLKHAAELAGFKKVKILEEPISAAIYAIKKGLIPQTCRGLLVYDFGAGTFDVAYVQMQDDGNPFLPIVPQGDICGGDNIDELLYDDWDKYLRTTKFRGVSSDPEEIDLAFKYRCRREKEQISRNDIADFVAEYVPGIGRVKREFSTNKFNELILPVIEKTISKTQAVLNEIKSKNLSLTHAILIGGSSRIPLVQEKLQKLLGQNVKIISTGDMDIAVAVGATYSVHTEIKQPDPEPIPPTPIPEPKVTSHYCIYCGNPILSSYKFCLKCGKPNYSYRP